MSEFASEGHESFPNIYQDYEQAHEFSLWPTEALQERLESYSAFLQRKDLMPRAERISGLIIGHIVFELLWRGDQPM